MVTSRIIIDISSAALLIDKIILLFLRKYFSNCFYEIQILI
jgi:hypothetical protein